MNSILKSSTSALESAHTLISLSVRFWGHTLLQDHTHDGIRSTMMDFFLMSSVFAHASTFRYRQDTCFEFLFVDQICMYQHAVHFTISERGEIKLNITFTKNIFWDMTLCCLVFLGNVGNHSPNDTET
jgi:hypothetical protein